jgi:hypothetical protein
MSDKTREEFEKDLVELFPQYSKQFTAFIWSNPDKKYEYQDLDRMYRMWLIQQSKIDTLERQLAKALSDKQAFADIINEQAIPCLSTCDSIAHDEFCPYVSPKEAYLNLERQNRELREALTDVKRCLEFTNDTTEIITDTIWYSINYTLFDFIDNTLDEALGG